MERYELSVIIPARNEEWLNLTLKDVLEKSRGKTEAIVILDGEWPKEPLSEDPRITVIYHNKSVGQRAAVNEGAKISRAKYIMKLDAHCRLDEGYDVKLMADCEPNWTVIPTLYNLHAFDWKCDACGETWYQGPTPTKCKKCPSTQGFTRIIKWEPRWRKRSDYMRFDSDLHFQYYSAYKNSIDAKEGMIIGYKLSFDTGSISPRVISLLAELTDSHQLSCCTNFNWFRENVSSNAVSLFPVDHSRSVRPQEILSIRNKSKMDRVTTSSIITNVIDNLNTSTPPIRDSFDKPGVDKSMCECFIPEIGTPTVSRSVNSPSPVPTTRNVINSDLLNKFNNILGGDFIYSEKTNSFHSGSVTLEVVCDNGLSETMGNLGACYFMHRNWFWELEGLDENHGSWGQMGTEISCKTWLRGGRQVVNKKTWYSHLFRTQGGDFSFPYPQSGNQVANARKYSQDLWKNNRWPKAVHDLDWLIKKFSPVPGWEGYKMSNEPTKGIIYYTSNQLKLSIAHACKKNIKSMGLPIVSTSLKPMTDMGKNIVVKMNPGYEAYYTQILTALKNSDADVIFFCEHDWLYHSSHFKFTPPKKDIFYYNWNWWRVRVKDGLCVHYDTQLLPGICAYKDILIEWYEKALEAFKSGIPDTTVGFEPGTSKRLKSLPVHPVEKFESEHPILDLRHESNLTSSKWSQDAFRSQKNCKNWIETKDVNGWGYMPDVLKNLHIV